MTKVLVVDDNPMDRHLAGGLIEKAGLTALHAGNGVNESVMRRLSHEAGIGRPDYAVNSFGWKL